MRRIVRETAFRLVRKDLLAFLEEHEKEMLDVFREEMIKLDERLPEENVFIDIKMVPLGEEIFKAALVTMKRILAEL
jgi:hypothetical protein